MIKPSTAPRLTSAANQGPDVLSCVRAHIIPKHPHWAIIEQSPYTGALEYYAVGNEQDWRDEILWRTKEPDRVFTAMHVMPAVINVTVEVKVEINHG